MSARIRILFISPRFGSIDRGAEVFVRELVTRLDKTRFDVTILSHFHRERIDGVRFLQYPTIRREGISKWYEPTLGKILRRGRRMHGPAELEALVLLWHASDALKQGEFDVIVPQGGSWSYFFADRYRKPGARIVSIGQSGPVGPDLCRSDHFVALTPFAVEEVRVQNARLPVTLIPNGVDIQRFRPSASRPVQRSDKTVLCVAALTADKRHDLLFDAVSLLPGNVRALCVGSGPEERRLGRHPLCRAGRVTFRRAAQEQMPHIYQQADVFSLASPDEAFGIAFLEALASGVNVVANNGPRQKFVLGNAGFLCDVYDRHAYARKLLEALQTNQSDINVRHAARFSWEEVARRYEDLFAEVAREKKRDLQ